VPIRLLIVDDNASFLVAARTLLERQGPTIAGVASTGAEALAEAKRLRPDVVLVDISLGDQSGLDLALSLVGNDPAEAAAVILISARASDDVVDLIAGCPAVGFLAKSELSADPSIGWSMAIPPEGHDCRRFRRGVAHQIPPVGGRAEDIRRPSPARLGPAHRRMWGLTGRSSEQNGGMLASP
jgi:two-component system nitrate/nitrite response regulator NarL